MKAQKPTYEELEKQVEQLNKQVEYLSTVTDSAKDSIFVVLPDYKVEYVNEHAAKVLSLSKEEVEGTDIRDLFPPDIAKEQSRMLERVFSQGRALNLVTESQYSEKRVWVDSSLIPIKNSQGEITKVIGYARDITNSKETELQISEKEKKYRALVEHANDGIYMRNKNGVIDFVNDKFVEILEYKKEEVLGTQALSYVHSEDIRKIQTNPGYSDGFNGLQGRLRVVTKSGIVRYVDINTVPIVLKGEEKAFGIVRDITPRIHTEERLKKLTEVSHEGIIIHQNGKVQDVNTKLTEMLRIDYETALNSNTFDFIKPSFHKQIKDNFQKKFSGTYEIVAIRKDGTEFPAEVRVKTVAFNNETLRVVSINDISSRKRVEKELRQLSAAVKQSPVSIVITDRRGVIEYVNPRYTQVTGYSYNEILGQNSNILKSGQTPRKVYNKLWKDILSGKVWEGEFLNKRKDGTTYWEYATISPIQNEEGEIVSFIGIKEDITKRKETEDRLIESENMLRNANATKDKFFSILAHDLRGPVGNLMQLLDLLDLNYADFTDASRKEYLQMMRNLSVKTFDLLENLLTWSRIQLNKIDFTPELFNLNDILMETYGIFKDQLNQKEILFRNQIKNHLQLTANKESIKFVIRNLISNAVKFTNSGGLIETTAQLSEDHQYVYISVRDTGVGISPGHLSKLFDAEKNLTSKGTNNESGTGLGLVLCKEFVEKHGGEIGVESKPNEGSHFWFSIPVVKPVPDNTAIQSGQVN